MVAVARTQIPSPRAVPAPSETDASEADGPQAVASLLDCLRQIPDARKTSRAAGVHVLNVFVHEVRQVLWQLPIAAKHNEISALKQSLAELFAAYPFLRILTGDAMFTGEPLCAELIEHGRHYVFQVKADQKHLLEKPERPAPGALRADQLRGASRGLAPQAP